LNNFNYFCQHPHILVTISIGGRVKPTAASL
jgi:hypothetical protein